MEPTGAATEKGHLILRCTSCGSSARPLIRAVEAGGISVRCQFCGTGTEVKPDKVAPVVRHAQGCPKCGAARAEHSCPRCGLVYARWKAGSSSVAQGARADIVELWQAVDAEFSQPARHERFLAHCVHAGALAFAAARYAEQQSSDDVERASIAEIRRRQVRALAEVTYLNRPDRSSRRRAAKTFRRLTAFTGAVALVAVVMWAGTMVSRPHRMPKGAVSVVASTGSPTSFPPPLAGQLR